MNWIDVLLLVIVILAMWSGWKTGFIAGSVNLIVWIGSLVAGFLCYRYPGSLLYQYFPALGAWTLPLAFLITIILARIILSLLFNPLLRHTPEQTHRHELNHVLGIVPGLINGLIYATIIAALLLSVPLMSRLSATTRDSRLANKFAENVSWLNNMLSPIFNQAIQKSLTKFTVEPEANETVKLHFTVSDSKVREDLEAQMLNLVNEERTSRGLNPLK